MDPNFPAVRLFVPLEWSTVVATTALLFTLALIVVFELVVVSTFFAMFATISVSTNTS